MDLFSHGVGAAPIAASVSGAFQALTPVGKNIFGPHPTLNVLVKRTEPFAHEACVFTPSGKGDSLYVTSNLIFDSVANRTVTKISQVMLPYQGSEVTVKEIDAPEVPNPNGGINYEDGIVFCAQGSPDQPGGLAHMVGDPPKSRMLVDRYASRQFNSPNDVVVYNKDMSLWFTDPVYGSEQGIRPAPELPQFVYRWNKAKNTFQILTDKVKRPNGIAFNPDQTVVYISDTDRVHGDEKEPDMNRDSIIYRYDIKQNAGEPYLTNRTIFAKPEFGIPDGLKTDQKGNVYAGCGDGINIWSPAGIPLAKILIRGGAANFCFGREGAMYILNENIIWLAQLSDSIKGALLNL